MLHYHGPRCFIYHGYFGTSRRIFLSQVARHLAKLFDSMASLKFEEDASGEPTKIAIGMTSKDKEYVDFDKPCELVGQVGINALLESEPKPFISTYVCMYNTNMDCIHLCIHTLCKCYMYYSCTHCYTIGILNCTGNSALYV